MDRLSLQEEDAFHGLPNMGRDLLCGIGVNVFCEAVLPLHDPRMELVFRKAVFHTEGFQGSVNFRKAVPGCLVLFSFKGKPLFYKGTVPLVLPEAGKALPYVFYEVVRHQESGEEPETLAINVPEDKVKAAFREHMTHHFLDKQVEEDIVNEKDEVLAKAGDKFTADVIEKILEDGTVKELKIRNNEVDGVYVEAITSGKNKSTVLESLRDRLVGRTLAEDIADKDGKVIYHINDYITEDMADVIADLREKVKIRSVLTCKSHFGVCRACYGRNLATAKKVEVGEAVGTIAAQAIGEPGTQLTMRTFHTGGVAGADDITQGLPRVEELFEARKPKHPGILTEVAGTVDIQEKDEGRFVVIRKEDGTEESYHIPYGAKIHVAEGDKVEVGDRLTEGSLNPHDILRISGPAATRHYLVQQVLGVYKSQGVEINDKHVEVMVRQMMRKYKIDEAGDTNMLPGSVVDIAQFEDENDEVLAEGKQPATGHPILLGITKASLATDSFLSAASFQETTRNLTDAAIKGKVDPLLGLKENVIIGKLIPAGTGMPKYRNIQLKIHRPAEAAEEAPAVTSEAPAAEAPAAEAPVEE